MDKPRIAIVFGDFHKPEMDRMLGAAMTRAEQLCFVVAETIKVPGAYEAPLAIKRLLVRDDIDAVAVLGIIERGETAHGRVMAQSVSDAIVALQLEFMKPVGFGIIGPEIDPHQFEPRLVRHAEAAVASAAAMLAA